MTYADIAQAHFKNDGKARMGLFPLSAALGFWMARNPAGDCPHGRGVVRDPRRRQEGSRAGG